MALLEINVVGSLTDDQRTRLLADSHRTLVEVLKVPSHDPTVLISHVPPTHAITPGGRSSFVLARVTMFTGRSQKTIAHLIQRLGQAIGEEPWSSADVTVVVLQSPRHCWSAEGGPTAADVDLGFDVEI